LFVSTDVLTINAEVATRARKHAATPRAAADRTEPPDGLVAVLDHVRANLESSRAELVEATGLGRSIVTQRVEALIDHGLLAEDRLGPSTGGRAPRLLRFRADAGYVLVADLGATSADVALADLSGEIVAHRQEPSDIAAGPEDVLGRVERLFDECIAEAGSFPGSLWGIGIGVPGPVEFESGRPISPPIMPGWDGYEIRERFAEHHVPVWVDNDVNVMALGELTAGCGRGVDDFVFVKLGTGIGAGIVVDGRIHRGAQGSAGDVGHIYVQAGDREVICRCGMNGCLEAFAGGAALGRDAEAAAREGRSEILRSLLEEQGSLSAADVALGSKHGDPVCVELITEAGKLIGQMLTGVVNFFNPSLVVIGGGVAGAGDLLLATIRQTIYSRSLPLSTRDLVVRRSALDGRAGVTGAATMVANELFAPDFLPGWLGAGTPARRP
jgi:glucokinase-like ROK family protein